jgi:hypothetical protein
MYKINCESVTHRKLIVNVAGTAIAPDRQVVEGQAERVRVVGGVVGKHVTVPVPAAEHHVARQADPVAVLGVALFAPLVDRERFPARRRRLDQVQVRAAALRADREQTHALRTDKKNQMNNSAIPFLLQ